MSNRRFILIKVLLILSLLLTMSATNFAKAKHVERFDLEFKNTPLKETLMSIGFRSNHDIVINGDLQGTVSLSLQNKSIYEILELLAMTHGFTYQYENNVVLISPTDSMSLVKSYQVEYIDLEYLKSQLALFLPANKVYINKDDSILTVDGSPAQHNKVAEHLSALDKPVQQILVQATIFELNNEKARNFGLEYEFNNYLKGDQGIFYTLTPNLEETMAKGRVLARPSIVTHNGRAASILMGDKVPVFTSDSTSSSSSDSSNVTVEYKDVGVNLNVLARINNEDMETITLALKPEISTITRWIESGNNKAPQISSREVETIIRVKSGQTIIIGGLLKQDEIENIKAIPFLSKLPFFGNIFKNKNKSKTNTEILIAITPKIVKDNNGVPIVSFDAYQDYNPLMLDEIRQKKNNDTTPVTPVKEDEKPSISELWKNESEKATSLKNNQQSNVNLVIPEENLINSESISLTEFEQRLAKIEKEMQLETLRLIKLLEAKEKLLKEKDSEIKSQQEVINEFIANEYHLLERS